jgi:hypothetical protein
MRLAALLLVLVVQPLFAQAGGRVLVVSRGGAEVGREQFTLADGRDRDAAGSTLVISSSYPGESPVQNLDVKLQRDEAGQLILFQMDVKGTAGTTHILAAGRGARLLLQTVAENEKAGRELPGGSNLVLLDSQALMLYQAVADLASESGTRVTAIEPRTGTRSQITATRAADGSVALSGDVTGTLRVDAQGQLASVELPSSGISAQVR